MKLRVTKRTIIVASTLLVATAIPSYAIFGLGDIVFDPSAYAEMIIQKSQQVEELAKLEAQLETALNTYQTLQKSYETTMNTYDTILNSTHRFTSKTGWIMSVQRLLKRSNVQSRFGETDGFSNALNTVSGFAADEAWEASQVRMDENNLASFMNGQPSGQTSYRSQLAMIEASDAVSPNCLSAVGTYSQQRSDNGAANDFLQSQIMDETDDTNTEIEQLNLLNAANAQHFNELQSQGALHSCIASQLAVANMQQRNAAAAELNTLATIRQIRATNSMNTDNGSYIWTHYLP